MANDRFIELITKELCDGLTSAEQAELQLLLQDNAEYRDQRELFWEYWESDKGEYEASAAMFKNVMEKIRAAEAGNAEWEGGKRRVRHLGAWFSAAAVVLVVISLVVYHYRPHRDTATLHWLQKSTLPTKKSVLTFADGTVITLNSGTTLRYPDHFDDSTRQVYLEGEAFFDVGKDPQRPFIIHTNKMNIRVLGTSFNVKSYQNEVLSEAALIKGSIEVTLNDRPSDRIILSPNEKLIVQNNRTMRAPVSVGTPPQALPQEDTDRATRYSLTNLTYFSDTDKTVVETSWVENKLVFSDKDFMELASQLERWFGLRIVFGNDKIKEYRFGGMFEKESLPEVLDALKMTEAFNYKISDSTVYIY